MRKFKVFECILDLCLLLSFMCCKSFAMDSGFEVSEIDESEWDEIFSRCGIYAIEEPTIGSGFCCFDVNEAGEYLLCFDGTEKQMILVYDSSEEYLYGFSVDFSGTFGAEFDDDGLIIYPVRSNLAIKVDREGDLIDMKSIDDTVENHDYWRKEIEANERVIGDTRYNAEHWLINHKLLHWGQYPKLVKTLPDGERIVLFENDFSFLTVLIPIGIISLVGAPITVYIITKNKVIKRDSL